MVAWGESEDRTQYFVERAPGERQAEPVRSLRTPDAGLDDANPTVKILYLEPQ